MSDQAKHPAEERPADGSVAGMQPDTPLTASESEKHVSAERESEIPAQPEPDAKEGQIESLRAKVTELEAENSDLKDQYLRKQADFENFRKRLLRDKEDAVMYGNQQLLLDLVTVIDDFERAIRSAEESRDFDAFHDGVVLIEKQLVSMMARKYGCERFESQGEEFDPQRHEAVASEARDDVEQPTVAEDYLKGYTLHGRVLRSAKVKVVTPTNGR